jgi:hypothetical protein
MGEFSASKSLMASHHTKSPLAYGNGIEAEGERRKEMSHNCSHGPNHSAKRANSGLISGKTALNLSLAQSNN